MAPTASVAQTTDSRPPAPGGIRAAPVCGHVRTMLRRATHGEHQALSRTARMRAMLHGAPRLATVISAFQGLFDAHLDFEAGRSIHDSDADRLLPRVPMLEKDLNALGATRNRATARPRRTTALGRLAYDYVVEGSALGAAVVAERLQHRFGGMLPPLHYYGEAVREGHAERFARIVHEVEALPSRTHEALVIETRAVFRAFRERLA